MTILGIISLVCFLALVIKYPLRKLGFNKANAAMMKLHELASFGVFACGIAQIIIGIRKYGKSRPTGVITGCIAYAIDVIIIAACHMTKNPQKKMRDHRHLSLGAAAASLIHIIAVILGK